MMLRVAECPCSSSHWQPWWLQKQHSNQCCKFTYRNEGGSFNASFSVANGISISEQWQDRTGDETTRFLSHGWNTPTAPEVQLKLAALPSLLRHSSVPIPAANLEQQGRARVEQEVSGMCSAANTLSSQCTLIQKSPSSPHAESRSV